MFSKVFQRACVLIVCVISLSASAREEPPATNYVYANYLGSGYYSVGDSQVAIVTVPFSRKRETSGPYASNWRLPVSVGSYSFKFDPEDVRDIDLPRDVGTLTFVPGIEWIIPLSDQWHLEPYVDFGVGTNFNSSEDVLIYSIGLSSFYRFGNRDQYEWVNRIYYAGDYSFTTESTTNFATLQSGLDWRVPGNLVRGEKRYFATLYTMVFWHFNKVELAGGSLAAVTLRNNFEVGFTLGVEDGPGRSWFNINRLGFGYRFGDGLESWRIFFSVPI